MGEQTAAHFTFGVIIVKAQELFLVQYQEIVQAAGSQIRIDITHDLLRLLCLHIITEQSVTIGIVQDVTVSGHHIIITAVGQCRGKLYSF